MKKGMIKILGLFCLTSFTACSQNTPPPQSETMAVAVAHQKSEPKKSEPYKTEPHKFGGWYCPDNLFGFPAVDIQDWNTVPVVNGRMATKKETQSEKSLIFVDPNEYPNAKSLPILMPKLARFYNTHTNRDELVIVIQAIEVANDSIVGFRYLNGGNGSARLNEVKFLSDAEIEKIAPARFVSLTIPIDATPEAIWKVLTTSEYTPKLQLLFDKGNQLKKDWKESTNVNYSYPNAGTLTATYGDELYGNRYIQNDYSHLQFTEKFLITVNQETKNSGLTIMCGPYATDFESQKRILTNWAAKVKELSESQSPDGLLNTIPNGQ